MSQLVIDVLVPGLTRPSDLLLFVLFAGCSLYLGVCNILLSTLCCDFMSC